MNASLARRLARLYPRAWRVRYGEEFIAMLETLPGTLPTLADVVRSALYERIHPIKGVMMSQDPRLFRIFSTPSAFLPLAMSLTALAVMAIGPAIFHDLHAADEGPTAHLWQMLMAGQVPIILFFAIKWLPRAARRTWQLLAFQVGAVLVNVATVFLLGVA